MLRHLDASTIARLQLRRVDLALNNTLEMQGQAIESLYFLEEGIGSMTAIIEDGAQVEVSMFGYESVIGVSALMGTRHSLNRVFMQLPGYGFASSLQVAGREFAQGDKFQDLALRYFQTQLIQSMQSAACNALHSHEQRLAKWIVICSDRARTNTLKSGKSSCP